MLTSLVSRDLVLVLVVAGSAVGLLALTLFFWRRYRQVVAEQRRSGRRWTGSRR